MRPAMEYNKTAWLHGILQDDGYRGL